MQCTRALGVVVTVDVVGLFCNIVHQRVSSVY